MQSDCTQVKQLVTGLLWLVDMDKKDDEIEVIESVPLSPESTRILVNGNMADKSQTKKITDKSEPITVSTCTPSQSNLNTDEHSEKQNPLTTKSSRKRLLSPNSQAQEGTPSKSKKILGSSSIPKTRKPRITRTAKSNKPKTNTDNNPDVTTMFQAMMAQFTSLRTDLTDRIDLLESNIENKITQRVSTFIDNKLKTTVNDIKSQMTQEVKSTVSAELSDIRSRLENVEKVSTDRASRNNINRELILVIRNLHESEREKTDENITVNKVKALIADGLKLRNIDVVKTQRKHSRNYKKHGVVILTVANETQKKDILSAKSKLGESHTYRDVFIEIDTPYEQRVNSANMATILREMGKTQNLTVHNGRIVNKQTTRGRRNHDQAPPTGRSDYGSRDAQSQRNANRRSDEYSRDQNTVNSKQTHVSHNNNNRDTRRTNGTGYRAPKSPRVDNNRLTYAEVHHHDEFNPRNDNYENDRRDRRQQQSSGRYTNRH